MRQDSDWLVVILCHVCIVAALLVSVLVLFDTDAFMLACYLLAMIAVWEVHEKIG